MAFGSIKLEMTKCGYLGGKVVNGFRVLFGLKIVSCSKEETFKNLTFLT